MNLLRLMSIGLYLGGIFISPKGMAQSPLDYGCRTYDYAIQSSAWLKSVNPSGVMQYRGEKISYAQVGVGVSKGSFINYYDSDDQYHFGITTKSIFRLSDKIVVRGGVHYSLSEGKNMLGSVFFDPQRDMPFNIVEYDSVQMGMKTKEIYRLEGGVAYALSSRFNLGAKLNFISGNYAKLKDLRHKNKLSDLDLQLGGSYQLTENLLLGGAYLYNKRVEGISFSQYGTTDRVHAIMVDYGGFMGKKITFDENSSGMIGTGEQPILDKYQGGAVQLGINYSNWSMFIEGEYKTRTGEYGIESVYDILHTQHEGKEYHVMGELKFNSQKIDHKVTFLYKNSNVINFENIYREINHGNGHSEIVYYDPLQVGEKSRIQSNIYYQMDIGRRNEIPNWMIRLGAHKEERDIKATLYPFYRIQSLSKMSILANISKKWTLGEKGTLHVDIIGKYAWGEGKPYRDGTFVTPSVNQKQPFHDNTILLSEYEYLTSTQLTMNPSIEYSHKIKDNIGIYLNMNYAFQKSLDKIKTLTNSNRELIRVAIGCEF